MNPLLQRAQNEVAQSYGYENYDALADNESTGTAFYNTVPEVAELYSKYRVEEAVAKKEASMNVAFMITLMGQKTREEKAYQEGYQQAERDHKDKNWPEGDY